MLGVAAGQVGDPVSNFVLMKPDDLLRPPRHIFQHSSTGRSQNFRVSLEGNSSSASVGVSYTWCVVLPPAVSPFHFMRSPMASLPASR